MNFHPLCLIAPEMVPAQMDSLRESIKTYGVQHPVIILDGMILDGRHRWTIATELGLKCPTRMYDAITDGPSPTAFVGIQHTRRDMTASQRAAYAAELVPFLEAEASERQKLGTLAPREAKVGKSAEHAAKHTGASRSSVERAVEIKKTAPEAFEKIKKGESTVGAEHKKIKAPPRPAPKPEAAPEPILDAVDKPVPESMVALFNDESLDAIVKLIDESRKRIKEAAQAKIGFWLDQEIIDRALNEAKRAIKYDGKPYAVCPYQPNCQYGCKACQKAGWLPKHRYELLPEELRK